MTILSPRKFPTRTWTGFRSLQGTSLVASDLSVWDSRSRFHLFNNGVLYVVTNWISLQSSGNYHSCPSLKWEVSSDYQFWQRCKIVFWEVPKIPTLRTSRLSSTLRLPCKNMNMCNAAFGDVCLTKFKPFFARCCFLKFNAKNCYELLSEFNFCIKKNNELYQYC